MCENGQIHELSRLPFSGMESDVVSTLIFKARNASPVARPNYHEVLYTYFMVREDYRNAAKWMCQYGLLLRKHSSIDVLDSLLGRTKAYLVAINALSLLPGDDAWIALDKHIQSYATEQGKFMHSLFLVHICHLDITMPPVLTLKALRQRYAVDICHLHMIQSETGINIADRELTVAEAVALLNSIAQFEMAFTLCQSHEMSMNLVFKALATHCIRNQLRSALHTLFNPIMTTSAMLVEVQNPSTPKRTGKCCATL
jgi:nuclear pore complex protein Nup160